MADEPTILENKQDNESRYRLTTVTVDETVVDGRKRFQAWSKPEFDVIRLGTRATDKDYIRHVVTPG